MYSYMTAVIEQKGIKNGFSNISSGIDESDWLNSNANTDEN